MNFWKWLIEKRSFKEFWNSMDKKTTFVYGFWWGMLSVLMIYDIFRHFNII